LFNLSLLSFHQRNGARQILPAPPHELVVLRWPGDPGAPGGRANRRGFAYQAHVPGPIAAWDIAFPGALAADLARTEEAVRELDRHGSRLAALAWPLLRAEAIASSRIEGLPVDHHGLALAERDATDDPAARAVAGNLAALRRALTVAEADPTPATFDDIHRALLAGAPGADHAGRVREVQNWIGGHHPNPRGAAFVPPPPERVPALLADLAAFCARDDLPAVAQAAIAHVQFETIHPHVDGNGRVGRALVQLILRRRGLARAVLPPVSLVLAALGDRHVRGLTSFRTGDAEAWLAFFNGAVHRAARVGEDLADAVTDLQEEWSRMAGHPRRDSAAAALIRRLPEEPIVDLAAAVRLTGATPQATLRAIDRLAGAGVLREISGRRRGRLWESAGLFALLDGVRALGPPRRRLSQL
jgi:Fic family protein